MAAHQRWKAHALDGALLAALLGLTFFVRWHTLERIESGGDPLDNWFFVRQWHYNDDSFSGYLNHHNARVGIHWLTWVCQKLFGTQATVYFVPSLIASHVCSALVFVLGRITFSRSVGVAATLLLLEFNPFIFASSQLRPGVFEAMYILATTVFIAQYAKGQPIKERGWLLVAAGSCAFMAYLVKVPTLFCSAGAAVAILLAGGGLRGIVLYAAPLAIGFGLETLAYNLFTEYPHRLGVIMNAHGRHSPRAHSFWYLFRRFTGAKDSWKLVYYFFFATGLSALIHKRPKAQRAVVLIAASYLFLITFGVRRLNPVGVWVGMRDRYLTAVAPLALVVNAGFLVEVVRALGSWLVESSQSIPRLGSLLQKGHRPAMIGTLTLAAFLVAWKVSPDPEKKRRHAVEETRRVYELMTDAYRRNLPIVGRVTRRSTKRRPWQQVRALHWAGKGFIADQALLDDQGRLPTFSYRTSVKSLNSKYSFMPTSAGSASDVKRLRKKDKSCVLWLRLKGHSVRPSNKGSAMPKDCPGK